MDQPIADALFLEFVEKTGLDLRMTLFYRRVCCPETDVNPLILDAERMHVHLHSFHWSRDAAPHPLTAALDALSVAYPALHAGSPGTGAKLSFECRPDRRGPRIAAEPDGYIIQYGALNHALRGVGALLSGVVMPGTVHEETTSFTQLGVMIDCSRNAVMTVDHLKRWLNQLALLGYNQCMLYTEDTYELPGEPCFGYLRGRYTAAELKAVDDHAAALGIELVGCIQTLGHLEQALKWSPYQKVKDTARVLLVDEERTYALIDKMMAQCAAVFRSRRVHIGMDETHDLGRGAFLDRFGYTRGYDLFQRHLARVREVCRAHGLQPMIWSDMYFRMGNARQNYYLPETVIPDDVKAGIPDDVQLVYWDYYHDNEAFYSDWIERHRDLDHEPIMASGVWTWGGHFGYAHHQTKKTLLPCIAACRNADVKELFFTLWGDDGAYCEFDTALAGLALAAEYAYEPTQPSAADTLDRRFAAICGADYQAVLTAAQTQKSCNPALLFWDDPLLGIYWKNEALRSPDHWTSVLAQYDQALAELEPVRSVTQPIDMAHWYTVIEYLWKLIRFRLDLDVAYAARDTQALQQCAAAAQQMVQRLEICNQTFRRQWYRRNKPNGFETIQHRIGARKQRWAELAQRLEELIDKRIDRIPELDERLDEPISLNPRWHTVATSGIG